MYHHDDVSKYFTFIKDETTDLTKWPESTDVKECEITEPVYV